MTDLPPFKPLRQFPAFLAAEDAPVLVPVERLTDEQARAYWIAQADFFVQYVQARRALPAARKGLA